MALFNKKHKNASSEQPLPSIPDSGQSDRTAQDSQLGPQTGNSLLPPLGAPVQPDQPGFAPTFGTSFGPAFGSGTVPPGGEVKPLAPPLFGSGQSAGFPGLMPLGQSPGLAAPTGLSGVGPSPLGHLAPTASPPPMPSPMPAPMAAPAQQAPPPGKAAAPPAPGGGQPQQPPSMFKAQEAARNQLLPEDLPYANEVEAALARKPKKSARLLSLAVCLFFFAMLFWASRAYVDEVTHAEGQVISSQRTQSIQNLEGGILREIMVTEGQIVEAGDILARLDNETAESTYRDLLNKAIDNYTAIIRLEAELTGMPPQYPDSLSNWLQELTGRAVTHDISAQANQAMQDQKSAFAARSQQRNAELQVMHSVYEQRLLEVDEMLARRKQLEDNLSIATEQRDMALPLVERGSYSRLDFLGLQQNVLNLQNEIETLATGIPRAQAAAREAEQRIAQRQAELDAAITEEINRRRQELASVRENLAAGGDRVTRTELRSPVRGTVNQIAVTTLGGVVKPGESIMEIVPLDDTLLIEARVKPSDVAFLMPGQSAMVKISAFDFSIFGGLEGQLEQISADTFEDRQGNFYYLVRVRTEETAIEYRGAIHPIIPGMMATVDIMIGRKTVLDYILKPILKARQNAFRER